MLLAAMVAFAGTLVAFAGVTALLRGWFETRHSHLIASSVVLVGLSAGLGSTTIALALGFRPPLFRAYHVGVALIAMLWLGLAMIELISRRLPTAFAARLLVISFSVVGGVVLALDPLQDVRDITAFSPASDLYLQLPLMLLTGAHIAVVVIVSASFFAVAMRAWRGEEDTGELFVACLLMVVAALLVFIPTRPELVALPAVAYVLMLTAAAGLVWFASVRAMGAPEAEEEDEPAPRQEQPAPMPPPQPEPAQPRYGDDETSFEEWLYGAEPQQKVESPASAPTAPTPSPAAPPPAPEGAGLDDACGFIVIFTLREGAARSFDRLAESTVQAIQDREPGTLIYTCHSVQDAPQQRIFYELYRDRGAMADHEAQPHVRRFLAEREQYVLATNVVRLKLNSHTGLRDRQVAYGR